MVRVRFAESVLDENATRYRGILLRISTIIVRFLPLTESEYLIGEQVSKHSGEFVSAVGGDFICVSCKI